MTDDSLFLIDIDKILRAKAPKRYKYIPKFLISYLKKIVHQEYRLIHWADRLEWLWAMFSVNSTMER